MAVIEQVALPGVMGPGNKVVALNLDDFIDDWLWATAEFSNADTGDLQLFSASRGQTQPGSTGNNTDLDTNIVDPGRLPTGWQMYIFSIGIEVATAAATVADHQNIQNGILSELWIVSKSYSEGRVSFFPHGGGIAGHTTATAATVLTNGVAAAGARRVMTIPHKIGEHEAFYHKLRLLGTSLTLSGDTNIAVSYTGIIGRSVQ